MMLHLQPFPKGGIPRCRRWERPSRLLWHGAQGIAEHLVLRDRGGQRFQFLVGKEQQNVTEDPGQRYRVGYCMVGGQQQRAVSRIATYDCPDQWRFAMIKGYLQLAAHLARPAEVGVTHAQRNASSLLGD